MKKYKAWLCGLFLFGIAHAQYTVLHNFTDSNGAPGGDLTLVGKKLYGMTGVSFSSEPFHGSVFSMDTDGTHYKVLHTFDSTAVWYSPLPGFGSLAYSNGVLFGMTPQGGKDSEGNIFAIDTDGSYYRELFSFDTSTNRGAFPAGSLLLSGKKFYGMTFSSSSYNDFYGCIFSIDTSGSGYKILHYFGGIFGLGSRPYGSLILSGRKLYGMSSEYGMYGNIFSMDTDGNEYTTLHEFAFDGGSPFGSLLLSKGVLYGMSSGETSQQLNPGNIFSIDTDGSNYREIGGPLIPGGRPFGTFILSGSVLYGMTSDNIFSIDTDDSNFTVLFDYTNSIYGSDPCDALTLSGNILYGMTQSGGTNNYGVIFKIDTDAIAGVNNLTLNKEAIEVYPNPTQGNVTVQFNTSDNENVEFMLYNLMGEVVYDKKVSEQLGMVNQVIDMGSLPNGIYLLKVNEGDKYMTQKIVKQY